MPDRRAEEPEDARLSGSMEHNHTHARQAGRGTRRCPPVWQNGARQHTCQTGGPRNQKMPACLAGWSTTTHMPDRRAEEPEDSRLSGSMEHDNTCQTGGPRNQKMPACLAEWSTTTHARQAGRGTRRCPPVWQHGARQHMPDRRAEEPEDARLSGRMEHDNTCQTGGPRNQKMPACLAAWSTTTHARQAGRGTRRCPPVWQNGARQHMPDRRAEELEDARLSGSMEHDNTCQTGGPRN